MELLSALAAGLIIAGLTIIDVVLPNSIFNGYIQQATLAMSSAILVLLSVSIFRANRQKTSENEKIVKAITASNTELSTKFQTLTESIGGAHCTFFKTSHEEIEYRIRRINEAKRSVDDLTWGDSVSPGFTSPTRQHSEAVYVENIKKIAEHVPYRELFILSHPSRVNKLYEHYQAAMNNDRTSKYSCSHMKDTTFPRLEFLIIDGEEIIFTGAQYGKCSVKSQQLAKLFATYFDKAWNISMPLIENGKITDESDVRSFLIRLGIKADDLPPKPNPHKVR